MLLLVTVLFSLVGCGEDSSSGDDVAAGNYGADNESSDTTHTHSYTEEIDEPSCRFSGIRIFTCSCGDYYTEDIPATGVHNWKEATCESPKHCSECYLEEGNALGHSWKEADCEDPKECTRCGEKDGWSGTGHTWKDATCKNPKTCTKCGKESGSALTYHSYSSATCTEPGKCTVCGAIGDPAKGHRYDWDGICDCGTKNPLIEIVKTNCSLNIPSLPVSYNSRDYRNNVLTTIKITNITYVFDGNYSYYDDYHGYDDEVDLTIYFSGSKIYDISGSNISSRFALAYKLYDASGNVVDSGSCSTTSIAVGDSFSNIKLVISSLPLGNYKLVLMDSQ